MGQTYLFGASPAKLREISFKVKEQVLGGHLYTTTGILKTNKAELYNGCEIRPLALAFRHCNDRGRGKCSLCHKQTEDFSLHGLYSRQI